MSWESVRHRVAVAGRVTDGQTGRTLAGVRVEITTAPAAFTSLLALRRQQYGDAVWAAMSGAPERPDRARTAADGHFHFLDLPAGGYTLTATLPAGGSRYGTATASFTLTADGQGNIGLKTADLALPPTALKGKVSGPGSAAVPMAELRLGGSGERTWSDGTGGYLFTGVEAGARVVLVSASGFAPQSQPVQAAAGAVATLDLTLTPTT